MKVFLCILLGILIVGIILLVCIAPCMLSSKISGEEEKRELKNTVKEKE